MRFKDLREAIIMEIRGKLPELQAVSSHPGRFNLDELKRIVTQLPAVRLALMGIPRVDNLQTGENEAELRLAAFVITGDRRQSTKDSSVLAIVESLLTFIPGQHWGIKGVMDARNVKADNLFSGSVERQGVALWAITWDQSIRISKNIWEGGVIPSELYASDDSGNAIEDYERVI